MTYSTVGLLWEWDFCNFKSWIAVMCFARFLDRIILDLEVFMEIEGNEDNKRHFRLASLFFQASKRQVNSREKQILTEGIHTEKSGMLHYWDIFKFVINGTASILSFFWNCLFVGLCVHTRISMVKWSSYHASRNASLEGPKHEDNLEQILLHERKTPPLLCSYAKLGTKYRSKLNVLKQVCMLQTESWGWPCMWKRSISCDWFTSAKENWGHGAESIWNRWNSGEFCMVMLCTPESTIWCLQNGQIFAQCGIYASLSHFLTRNQNSESLTKAASCMSMIVISWILRKISALYLENVVLW